MPDNDEFKKLLMNNRLNPNLDLIKIPKDTLTKIFTKEMNLVI